MARIAFKSNDLAILSAHRLMPDGTAEPLFTPIQANLVKQTAFGQLL
jgi:hypothetical protein